MSLNLTQEQGDLLVEILTEHHRRAATTASREGLEKLHALNDVIFAEYKPKTYTVIVREDDDGYADPLIYTVEIGGRLTEEKVMAEVRKKRAIDLDGDGVTEGDLDSWLGKLLLCFAFEGDLDTAADWRV